MVWSLQNNEEIEDHFKAEHSKQLIRAPEDPKDFSSEMKIM